MKTKFFALLALVLGMVSCAKDFAPEANVAGGEVDFTLAVSVPELAMTRAGDTDENPQNAKDSAFGAIDYFQGAGWNNVDLRYILEVYDFDESGKYVDENGEPVEPIKDRQVKIVESYKDVTFELRLVQGRNYHFVVFADFIEKKEDGTVVEYHTIGETLADIKINNDGINNELTDAYFATKKVNPGNPAHNTETIVLRRPYAKVRVVATDLAELNFNVDPALVEVTYNTTYPTAFNALTGAIGTKKAGVSYEYKYNKGVSKNSLENHYYTAGYDGDEKYTTKDLKGNTLRTHMTLFTDYILATEKQESINFTMTVYDDDEVKSEQTCIKTVPFITDIPVKRNHLTTIIGNVLTTATDVHVSINDNFENEEEIFLKDIDLFDDYALVYSAKGLLQWAYIVNNGATDALRAVKDFDEANFDRKKYGLKLMTNITLPAYEFAVENDSYVFTDKAITLDSENRPSGSNWPMVSPYPSAAPFAYYTGTIDGNGKTISGLRMVGGDIVYGFVGCMHKGAVVKNITFKDARVHATGGTYAAIVVAWNCDGATTDGVKLVNSSIYDSCPASNTNHAAGGIVGQNQRRVGGQNNFDEEMAYVLNCSTDANSSVYCENKGNVGGICGYNYGAIMYNCVNAADVAGSSNVGGVVGYHRDYVSAVDSYVLACKSTADATISAVSNASTIGGIAGYQWADGSDSSAWIVACVSESELVKGGAISGFARETSKIVGSWAVKNGVSILANKEDLAQEFGSFIYNKASEATQADVDAMNDAIKAYNDAAIEPEHPVLDLRWVLTADGPVLQ